MRKTPTVFRRDPDDRAHVLPVVHPGCRWVLDGEGRATRKWDGTCVMLDEAGRWWARHEVKPGKKAPDGYLLMETDEVTGKTVGWEPVSGSPFARFHAEAVGDGGPVDPGTYELLGPKINGNPDGFAVHVLMPHGWEPLSEYSVPGTAEAAGTGRASARVRVVAVRPAEQAVARSVRRVGFPLV